MYTLFLDTHDKNVIVVIFKDGKVLEKKDIVSANKHSQVTMPTIDEALKSVGIDINDINSIIVVNGPGSFTGERIAVTIAKTIAYCKNIPIRTIDSLTMMAINDSRDMKYVALEDRNGAFVGELNANNEFIKDIVYMNMSNYLDYKQNINVINSIDIDYELVYEYVINNRKCENPHKVNPLYVKGISALNDK